MVPIRRQYLNIKKRYPQAIVFFRLGDFYETFDKDAEVVARELGITLTAREMGKGQKVPLAGLPYHAVDGYLAKLIARGFHVAICEQLSDPKSSKGLVERDVVRVVTPGTVIEPGLVDEKRNNYLASVVIDRAGAGLAYADVTTGEFATTQFVEKDWVESMKAEMSRLYPSECLVPETLTTFSADGGSPLFQVLDAFHVTKYPDWRYDLETAREACLEHFGVSSLDAYGCAGQPLAVRAAGALIQYLAETQKAALPLLTELHTYSVTEFMELDPATRRNLELLETARTGQREYSLLWVLDKTVTAGGTRLLRQQIGQPLTKLEPLGARQEAVAAFVERQQLRRELRDAMRHCGDLERVTNRVGQRAVTPRELAGLRRDLSLIPKLKELFEGQDSVALAQLSQRLDPCSEVVQLLSAAIVEDPPAALAEGGVIAPRFSPELDGLREGEQKGRQWIANLERVERQRTGIKSLKVGYNKVFGYYIEVSNANRRLVPKDYIRKQTLVGAERYITPELKEYETRILNAQERTVELESQLFQQVCQQVAAHREKILATARGLAEIDVYQGLADVAVANRYVRPELNTGDEIRIAGGRHPVVELALKDGSFVPNDCYLSNSRDQILVITGPNMAGKSTYIRQAALIVLMAQIGSFVPADSATIGLVDRIFTRVGAQDEIAAGQSTFMVEMIEAAYILAHATPKSLVIIDEVGRGTSTYDGLAIAQAIVEYIHNHPRLSTKTLFATHYHELTELERFLPRVKNYNVAVLEEGDRVVFLHRIVPGGADRSYGIHVAKLAGAPKAVTRRASEILERLERGASNAASRRPQPPSPTDALQLSLFAPPNPALEELASLDVDSMSPLEALTKLYELQRKARESSERLGEG